MQDNNSNQNTPQITDAQKAEMFNYAQTGNLDGMKKLYAAGVPLNIKHPYHNATLLHQAIITSMIWPHTGFTHCHPEIIEWMLQELGNKRQLREVLNTNIACDKNQRKQWEPLYKKEVLALDAYPGKNPQQLFDDIYNIYLAAPSHPNSIGQVEGWINGRESFVRPECAKVRAEWNKGKQLLTKYQALAAVETSLPIVQTPPPPPKPKPSINKPDDICPAPPDNPTNKPDPIFLKILELAILKPPANIIQQAAAPKQKSVPKNLPVKNESKPAADTPFWSANNLKPIIKPAIAKQSLGYALAQYDYTATREDELTIKKGDKLTILSKARGDWWECQLKDATGLIPENHLREEITLPNLTTQYNYGAQKEDELSFKIGDKLKLIEKQVDGWWLCEMNNITGFVPGNYMEEEPGVEIKDVNENSAGKRALFGRSAKK